MRVHVPFLNRTITALFIPNSTPLLSMGQLVEDDFSICWDKEDGQSNCTITDKRSGQVSKCMLKLDCPYLCMAQSSGCPSASQSQECPNQNEGHLLPQIRIHHQPSRAGTLFTALLPVTTWRKLNQDKMSQIMVSRPCLTVVALRQVLSLIHI